MRRDCDGSAEPPTIVMVVALEGIYIVLPVEDMLLQFVPFAAESIIIEMLTTTELVASGVVI